MKLVLSKNVIGIDTRDGSRRVYAEKNDIVEVIIKEKNYYMCIGNKYKNIYFPVLESQISTIIREYDSYIDEEETCVDE